MPSCNQFEIVGLLRCRDYRQRRIDQADFRIDGLRIAPRQDPQLYKPFPEQRSHLAVQIRRLNVTRQGIRLDPLFVLRSW